MYLISYLTHSLCRFMIVLNFINAQALTSTLLQMHKFGVNVKTVYS